MRLIRIAALTVILGTVGALPALADTIDFGVNISSDGSTSQVANGFWGDGNDYTLSNSCLIIVGCSDGWYDFSIDTSALAEPTVESARLSFDFSDLGLLESIQVFAYSGTYQSLGFLGSVPLVLSLSTFGDEIANGLLNVRVLASGLTYESVKLDSANLQLSTTSVPEPATLLLTGIGMVAAAAFQRRRRQTVPPTAC